MGKNHFNTISSSRRTWTFGAFAVFASAIAASSMSYPWQIGPPLIMPLVTAFITVQFSEIHTRNRNEYFFSLLGTLLCMTLGWVLVGLLFIRPLTVWQVRIAWTIYVILVCFFLKAAAHHLRYHKRRE